VDDTNKRDDSPGAFDPLDTNVLNQLADIRRRLQLRKELKPTFGDSAEASLRSDMDFLLRAVTKLSDQVVAKWPTGYGPVSEMDRDHRAAVSRALGLWSGGLDGPPPSWDEIHSRLEQSRNDARKYAEIRRIGEMLDTLDKSSATNALQSADAILRRLRQILA
jgi:hypothetical protein